MSKVLFVGGTGQISLPCVEQALSVGHEVSVYNRGLHQEALPSSVISIVGDMYDPRSYAQLRTQSWDVVAQFMVFTPEQMQQDIDVFAGNTGQYIFISSASVYQKHPFAYLTSEAKTPAANPYWPYSQAKIACENLMKASRLPWTNVRPSHTARTDLPTMLGEGDIVPYRMLAGKPVLVAGDGTAIWTLTRSVDFARPFVRLFGNEAALHEDFHITSDVGFTWDAIYMAIASGLGVQAEIVHIPSDTLVRYRPEWIGPLFGDKTYTTLFDNSKIKRVAGDFVCSTDLHEILSEPLRYFRERQAARTPYSTDLEHLLNRMIADQKDLGARSVARSDTSS